MNSENDSSAINQYAAPESTTNPLPEYSFENLDPERAAAFVGPNYDYYAVRWRSGKGLNWAAGFWEASGSSTARCILGPPVTDYLDL